MLAVGALAGPSTATAAVASEGHPACQAPQYAPNPQPPPDAPLDPITAALDPTAPHGRTRPVNDPLFPAQWNLAVTRLPQAWAVGARGQGQVIAIVDTGVDLDHPDLAGKLLPGQVVATAADVERMKSGGCEGVMDQVGHGTTVAGIAAAATGNGLGIAGAAPDAKIVPIKISETTTELNEDQVAQVGRAIEVAADAGADVINFSAGQITDSRALNEAVEYAWQQGAVVVTSAGNHAHPRCYAPGRHPRVVCVAGSDRRGLPVGYSNLPGLAELGGGVAVRAPTSSDVSTNTVGGGRVLCGGPTAGTVSRPALAWGESVWTLTRPRSSTDRGCSPYSGYGYGGATSQAAPLVSGVAALLTGRGLSNADVLECLRRTSSNGGSYDAVMGYGVVDAYAAVTRCRPHMASH